MKIFLRLKDDPAMWSRVSFFLTFALLSIPALWTVTDYGIVYDEPIYMEDSWRVLAWAKLPREQMFSQTELEKAWAAPSLNVHPAGIKWLYIAAQTVVSNAKNPYIPCRLLTVLLFAACGALFFSWYFREQPSLAPLAGFTLLIMPRFFAHLHFASPDILLTAVFLLLVVLTVARFWTPGFWLIGIVAGYFLTVKITAVALMLPVIFILSFHKPTHLKAFFLRLAGIALLAGGVFFLLNPDWWCHPIERAVDFVRISLTRSQWAQYSCYFFGQVYTFRGPFYYPIIILLITTPLYHLITVGVRLVGFSRRNLHGNIRELVILAGALTPIFLLMLPFSPTNDMERYLLPAFPFLVCLSVSGLASLLSRHVSSARLTAVPPLQRWAIVGMIILLALSAVIGLIIHHPAQLSYFSEVIGGLPGGQRAGFEVTYWWECFNDEVLKQVNRRCAGEPVLFPMSPSILYFNHLERLGHLRFIPTLGNRPSRYMFIYGRPQVRFWERIIFPDLERKGITPKTVWEKLILGVPLMRLYRLDKSTPGTLPDQSRPPTPTVTD